MVCFWSGKRQKRERDSLFSNPISPTNMKTSERRVKETFTEIWKNPEKRNLTSGRPEKKRWCEASHEISKNHANQLKIPVCSTWTASTVWKFMAGPYWSHPLFEKWTLWSKNTEHRENEYFNSSLNSNRTRHWKITS